MRCKSHSLEVTHLLKTRGCCSGSTRFDVCTRRAVLGMTMRPDQGAASQRAQSMRQRALICGWSLAAWSFCTHTKWFDHSVSRSAVSDWWLILSLLRIDQSQTYQPPQTMMLVFAGALKHCCYTQDDRNKADDIAIMAAWYCHGCLVLPLEMTARISCGSPIAVQPCAVRWLDDSSAFRWQLFQHGSHSRWARTLMNQTVPRDEVTRE